MVKAVNARSGSNQAVMWVSGRKTESPNAAVGFSTFLSCQPQKKGGKKYPTEKHTLRKRTEKWHHLCRHCTVRLAQR